MPVDKLLSCLIASCFTLRERTLACADISVARARSSVEKVVSCYVMTVFPFNEPFFTVRGSAEPICHVKHLCYRNDNRSVTRIGETSRSEAPLPLPVCTGA